jgi:hypothetical protein
MVLRASEWKTYTPREVRVKLAEMDIRSTTFAEMVGYPKAGWPSGSTSGHRWEG